MLGRSRKDHPATHGVDMPEILLPNRKFKQLINPHSHTDASLDGASTVKDIIKINKEYGATHVCVTEHGNMNSLMDLYTECKKAGVKPILGIELYIIPPFMDEIEKEYRHFYENSGMKQWEGKLARKMREFYVHLTVHFKDYFAYQYFCQLTPKMEARSIVKGGEPKPLATFEEISGAAGHITICSSCLAGVVQKWLVPDRLTGQINFERARKSYEFIRNMAGPENFFVEIFPHQIKHDWKRPIVKNGLIIQKGEFIENECTSLVPNGDIQHMPNKVMLQFAKEYKDKCIISLDSHFARPDDKLIQDMRLGNGQEAWKFYNSYHVMTTDEAAEMLKYNLGVSDRDIEEWVDNSYEWASRFDGYKMPTSDDRWILPPINDDYIKETKRKIDFHGRMDWTNKAMVDQLKEELDLYTKNGKFNLLSYFFMLEDISRFCKENDILINVRGSAGGSLLAYLFGISAVNPQKHNLSLARFLTLGRIRANTLPDADIDISQSKREILFKYLREKYGDGFCQISIDSKLKLKSAIKDAERAIYGSVHFSTEKMCKKLPTPSQGQDEYEFVFGKTKKDGTHIKGVIELNVELQEYAKNNQEIWSTVSKALGIQRQKSVHACGCVIANEPIQNFVPLIRINDTWATGYGPKPVEAAGLVKVDLLGLQTLSDIENCLAEIKNRLGITLDPWNLPYDPEVFKQLTEGKTETVFQFDTPTILPYIMKIGPKSIEDLAKITSLGRPGTLDAPSGVFIGEKELTLAELYIECANGRMQPHFVHPDMSKITGDTYGVQLYQEQTIGIFEAFATYIDSETNEEKPYTKEQCEVARRGIGKKIPEVLASCYGDLRRGLKRFSWADSQVDLLIDQINASANYSFNKSHAMSYAYVAYACAYLKTHYKIYWWKGVLMNADRSEVFGKFWKYIKEFVVLPDLNSSTDQFEIIGDKLYAPLSMLDGIGPKTYEALVAHKPYKSLDHFIETHFVKQDGRSAVHKGIVYKLICAGSIDSLFDNPNCDLTEKLEKFESIRARVHGKKSTSKAYQVDPVYYNMSDLGKYLVKKDVVLVYSQDLRELVLSPRGGQKMSSGNWMLNDQWPCFYSGRVVQRLQQMASEGKGLRENVSVVAFVIKEEALRYSGKSKQATKLILDVDGTFIEVVMWPRKGENEAPMGFKKKIVLIEFSSSTDFFGIKNIQHILTPEQYETYNVI